METINPDSNLIRSPLFETIRNYLLDATKKKKHLNLFVPYIKTTILEKLLQSISAKTVIVTSWKLEDLLNGSSELQLYQYCKDHGIALYVNNSIHLKVYSGEFDDLILATGNISERGLFPNGNYEGASLIRNISNEDRLYFAKIKQESIYVNDSVYDTLLNWHNSQQKPPNIEDRFDDIIKPNIRKDFLISALPMTKDIKILEEAYLQINKGLSASDDPETRESIFHDLTNYHIPLKLTQNEFRKILRDSFFSHPFIKKINEFIDPEAYFGRIKEWIQNNCTDVPVPSRRELTGNVQVLLEWFEKLSDGKYIVDIPGEHSQRIRRVMI